ncbi:MAG TPA: siroheme synthase CysG [Thermoanaerobaculales bacterium]|nr:siroheme synthase CysG [Thermoanaerobaculales bacterium]HPA79915.1 siroheme synthase CysG [Thermoanaerobaculales bacterium]HQL30870.1 siroheme synthase CysG [Thermoanaerobaculales bacterium]HQN96978.1 siroheme synthase CysG [Thermoanaerobaculales bacterium]HQP42539.1 siroheme synthase CysG [Thermoanaerobaculales bacterium]
MYPVMLELEGQRCLVVGGGGVALRKVQGLIEAGARVTVVAPVAAAPLEALAAAGRIQWEQRPYRPGEAGGYALVLSAADDREVNAQVSADARAAGIWVNVADDPELCSFQLPARLRRGALQLAIGSAGEAPFAVRRLRGLLERRFGPEWGEWLAAAARFRERVRRAGLPATEQEARFERFFEATVDGDRLTARVPGEAELRQWLDAEAEPQPAKLGDPAAAGGDRTGGQGLVSLVGAGPGCPGLITVRGRRRLAEADAVVYDRLAAPALPCDLAPTVELHPVGKAAGRHPIPQEEINALLVLLARAGKRVVRLKGGDPYVFGRGGEEAEALAAAGIRFEVVPGVTSGLAALAWAGIPATHRREAVRLSLVTAHESGKGEDPLARWDLLAGDDHATLVSYMSVGALADVVRRLLDAGMDPMVPAAVIERGTTSAQRRVVSTLGELPGASARAGIEPPALLAIGPTVRHADRLDWHSRLPLAGQRLLMAAAGAELSACLEDAGAEVVAVPLPVTPAARVVMAALPLTHCLVRQPAEVDSLDDERGGPGWGPEVVTLCVGEETASRARGCGWQRVAVIEEDLGCAELVARIAAAVAAG